jgi:hypothetical protein
MKRFCLTAVTLAASLCAQEEKGPSADFTFWDVHPFRFGANGISNGGAELNHRGDDVGNLHYRKANAYTYVLLPISERTFFMPRFEWNGISVNWKENPFFSQTNFNMIQGALTFYTSALEDWRWIVRADYNVDADHIDEAADYSLYTGMLWGTYKIWRKWHYHIGALFSKGMETQNFYPIIGFDYSPTKSWLIELVFPVEYSIQFKFADYWRLAAKGRPLKERLRSGNEGPQPRSVLTYSSFGTELNLKFQKMLRFEAEAYAGWNWGGSFYVKDQNNNNPYYTSLEGSFYAGGMAEICF